MWKCQSCNKLSEPGVGPSMVVLETRAVSYVSEQGSHLGSGWEFAKTTHVCDTCKKKLPETPAPNKTNIKTVVMKNIRDYQYDKRERSEKRDR